MKKIQKVSTLHKGSQGKLGVGEAAFPTEAHTNRLSSANCSVLKTNIQETLYGLHRVDLRIYMYVDKCT